MQTDKGLSNSTCVEEQGGDDGFYLIKVGIIFVLCNKSLIVYVQGPIHLIECYPENYTLVNKAHSNPLLVQQLAVSKNQAEKA